MGIRVLTGDYGYPLQFTVKDVNGDTCDLGDYAPRFKVWQNGNPGSLLVNSACTVISAPQGTCNYVVAAQDFNSIGKFKGEIELTKAGIRESTEALDVIVEESS